MKDVDYDKIIELTSAGGGFLPVNQNAVELIDNSYPGEVISVIEASARDLTYHRAYFSLINYIYDWLPKSFKAKIPKARFYQFLKHLRGDYDVIFEFKDGTKFIEYRSIAFGKMSQKAFETYVKEQLPFIYEEVIGQLYEREEADKIIACIEIEYERFLMKL